MRLRWLGTIGAVLLLTSLVLMVAGPRLWPTAFSGGMMGTMMGGQAGMMPGGMMPGGVMATMMTDHETMRSMMSGEVGGDPSQPFDRIGCSWK